MKQTLFIRLASAVALTSLLALAGCATSNNLSSGRAYVDPTKIDETYPPAIVELNFDSFGKRLNGILYQANGAGPHPTVVLLHGYPGNEKNLDLAQALRRTGYNVLFFHYRGAWGSGGEFSYSHVIEDVASSIKFLRAKHRELRVDAERLLIVGHSMGGFAALQGASRDDSVKCVAGIAPANVGVLVRAVMSNSSLAGRYAAGADNLPMLNGWSGSALLKDIRENGHHFDVPALAPKLSGKSVLLIAGEEDTVLAPDVHHAPMVKAFSEQKGLALTEKALPGDHSFSWSRLKLIDTVLAWAHSCESPNQ